MQNVTLAEKMCISSSYRKMKSWGCGSTVEYLSDTQSTLLYSIIKTKQPHKTVFGQIVNLIICPDTEDSLMNYRN